MQKGEVFASPFLFVSCSGDLLFWRVFLVEHFVVFSPSPTLSAKVDKENVDVGGGYSRYARGLANGGWVDAR